MISKLIYLAFLFNLLGVLSQNRCDIINTCGECIRHYNSCKWCSSLNFTGSRCRSDEEPFKGCDDVENPKSFKFKTDDEDREFSSESKSVIQIKPQQYHIAVRPGESVDFDFSFKAAANYPADLYFLIDASNTMSNIKQVMIQESERIYKEMKKITDSVFLGLGTFIDKNALPYTLQVNSTATYSFHHRLNLSDNIDNFKEVANKTQNGVNYDTAEGGLDALAQVLACKKLFGWRKASRKIIVFLTNQVSHSAGEGKWAGITRPYDGRCYTNNNVYSKETEMDYPSFSMINKLAVKEEITVIFGVEMDKKGSYDQMSRVISGSKVVAFKEITITDKKAKTPVVTFNTANLEKVLTDIYKEMTQKIKIKLVGMTFEDRKHIQISFDPDCSSKKETYIADHCKVEIDKEFRIRGNLKLSRYYKKTDKTKIDVAIEGISEKLTLNVDIIKDCDCETNTSRMEHDADYCSKGGNLQCGICQCHPNRYGDKCKCKTNEQNFQVSSNASCIAPGDAELCSGGHGSCVCGTCHCLPRYTYTGYGGSYCECNENSCPSKCSNHGKCICGRCECDHDWTGELCDCYKTSDDKCRSEDGRICSNRGKCKCGACVCPLIATWDARRDSVPNTHCSVHCADDCQNKQCTLLTPCAVCHHRHDSDCHSGCHQDIIVNITDSLADIDGASTCEDVKVAIGCTSTFKYMYDVDEYKIKLFVQTKKECIPSFYWFGAGFLATLLLIGIGTIIAWKLLQDRRDRQEYERFVKQHKNESGLYDNPVYQPATTTFQNPAFRKRSFRS